MPVVLTASDFTVTRNEIIESALRTCGVLDPEAGTPSATQYTVGAQALNIIVKRFHDEGNAAMGHFQRSIEHDTKPIGLHD